MHVAEDAGRQGQGRHGITSASLTHWSDDAEAESPR